MAALRRTRVFAHVRTALLQDCARRATALTLAPGRILFRKGEPSDALYVVIRGRIRIHDGDFRYTSLGPGETFGEQAMIRDSYRTASATATTATRLLKFPRHQFHEQLRADCEFLHGVLEGMLIRIVEKDDAEQELNRHREELRYQRDELFRTQQELQASRARYLALYSLAPVGYLTLDACKRIAEVNLAAAALLGVPRKALVGRPMIDFLPPAHRRELGTHMRTLLTTGRPQTCELPLVRPDGGMFWAHLEGTRGRDDASGAPACFVTMSDISARKRAEGAQRQSEEALKRSHGELETRVAERTRELRAANAELQQRLSQLARLAAQLTAAEQRERRRLAELLHDHLQQLLVSARLQVYALAPRLNADAERARRTLQRTLDDAMEAARSVTRDLGPPIQPARDLGAALQWLARDARERHGLNVSVALGPRLRQLPEASAQLLFTAARELLLNVVKHAATRRAALRLDRTRDGVKLEVRDAGRGVRSRVPSASGAADGYGLISIRERTELLGGRLRIDSRPGKGTRVAVSLPRHTGRLPAP